MVSEEAKWEPDLSPLLSGNEDTLHSVNADYMRSSNEEHFPLDLNKDQIENLKYLLVAPSFFDQTVVRGDIRFK